MTLEILVVHAKNLPNVERFGGKSDPFVIISLQGIKKKTNYIAGSLDPVWNERLVFELAGKLPSADETVEVEVKDYEKIGRNRLLGTCAISLRNLLSGPQETDMDLTLVDKNNQPTSATLLLKVSYKASETKTAIPQTDGNPPSQPGTMPSMNLPPGSLPQSTAQLSTTVERYQIRVKVIEARQLLGSNLFPTCTVKTFQQTKHTKVAKATGTPFWNELFYFQITASLSEICEKDILFEVFHSKFARSNALIGSFSCSLSTVYYQPSHALINKWLMLSDPNDLSSGITGYLKISVVILGPGDECPDFGVATQSDSDDVEGNLLWPTGVELGPATFSLDVFHGEDLPRMDSGAVQELKKMFHVGKVQKELVDPYLIFSFAGKEVQTKIMYTNDHPPWKQKLNLGFMFPSMCNNIKLTVMDWDRLSEDDLVATASIPLSLISASGDNGFLPSFGPCFVNFYGSAREFSALGNNWDDEMNSGKAEGCSYRGRVLISLRSELGKFPSIPTSTLEDADVWRTESFCRRRRFILNAVFIDASMLDKVDEAVEFEVSIGNFGNKFENTMEPSSSSSQPTNAVFDGCQYYFLPWTDAKPCINIQCQWEDITFRLEAANVLTRTADTLEENLARLKLSQDAHKLKGDLAIEFIELIDQLIRDCSTELPESYAGQYPLNELDIFLKSLRQSELKRIVEEAIDLRKRATNLDAAIQEVETYLATLRHLAEEPQNSIPDIIIWMICGNKRTAYQRIPAQQILYSKQANANGKFCGKIQTITLKYPGKSDDVKIPVLLRVKLWLGLEQNHSNLLASDESTELTIFAETYENEISVFNKWKKEKLLMRRPAFSDAAGLIELLKEKFTAPLGWKFEGDWFVDPEPSIMYQADAGHKTFLEEVFENENRLPGGTWFPSPKQSHWTDVRGQPLTPRDEIECPQGWEWEDVWKYDVNRAVDEEGWEYTIEASIGGYSSTEKTFHLCRRRRWLRQRRLTEEIVPQKMVMIDQSEGWEYAVLFTTSFHSIKRKMDMVRRRRWHRKMIAEDPRKNPVFHFEPDNSKDSDSPLLVAKTSPRMYLIFKEFHQYQLRVYVYQARNLLAGDKTGFSDPYACIAFLNRSQKTEKIKKTLCPTWDQSLIFEDIILYGMTSGVKEQPPSVIIEIFDHDAYGEPDFLGRTMILPDVHLNANMANPAKLLWHQVKRKNEDGGEILAAAELFLEENHELPFFPPVNGDHYMVPNGVRPVLQRTVVEILCWGVRNLKTFELSSISNPSVEIECGGEIRQTNHIKNIKSNLNFETPLTVIEMMLPKEELYLPPLNLKLRDHRSFGRIPIVGTHVIKSLHSFQHTFENVGMTESVEIELTDQHTTEDVTVVIEEEETETLPAEQNEDVDWWSKYYASIGEFDKCRTYIEKGFERLEVIPFELEKVAQFKGLEDFLQAFPFTRGKSIEGEEAEIIGELKGTIRVYPIPDDPRASTPPRVLIDLPSSAPEEIVVRIYVVKAKDLAPKDVNCLADPYIEVNIGKQKLSSRERYKPNTLNPIFGEFFEMTAILPLKKDLKISVYDYDRFNKDDLIGETEIDLENRRYSNFRATCGLPKQYHVSGPNQWRDSKTPKEILEDVCKKRNLPKPNFRDHTSLTIGSKTYTLQEFERNLPQNHHLGAKSERLALHCLHTLNLVSEHIETRRLFNPAMPGLEQGKLEIWIDIFPKSFGPPGPIVDITPRAPVKYIVRCVIRNTTEVILDEANILGEKMSDIYVKGWISGINETQKTDVHYRSLDGEGNFNWRFVFPMDYLPAEQVVVVKKKEHFWSLDQTENKIPPKFCLQIWDNDKFSMDDFLGELELNLVNLPAPAKSAKDCTLDQLDILTTTSNNIHKRKRSTSSSKKINLFEKKRAYGFWPCVDNVNGEAKITGKIEMEIEIVTEEEAKIRPAGLARDEPNMNPHLDPPNRPATSFLWITSPWKSFRFILWKKFKWYFITFIVISFMVLFLLLFFYNVPEATIRKLFGTG